MLMSTFQFQQAVPCSFLTASTWHSYIERAMEEFGIDSLKRAAGFIAQMSHESAKFTRFEENLNYSSHGLANTWPSRYAVDPKAKTKVPNALALKLHRKPELIANHTYANRIGNGPPESGDGWLFRGRGPKQITGRANYLDCGQALGLDLISNPDLLLIATHGARAAAWFWASRGCNALIDADNYMACSKAINGGLIGHEDGNDEGLDDRVELWVHTKSALGVA